MTEQINIGISACLLGENVRWNGGHSRDRFLTDTLGLFVNQALHEHDLLVPGLCR
jgi:uncharacterized protein YbbK (DUF523 family)